MKQTTPFSILASIILVIVSCNKELSDKKPNPNTIEEKVGKDSIITDTSHFPKCGLIVNARHLSLIDKKHIDSLRWRSTRRPGFYMLLGKKDSLIHGGIQETPEVPLLPGTILYFDFDGGILSGTSWNWNGDIDVPASQLSEGAKDTIVARAAQWYAKYDIYVTRNKAEFLAAPADRRMRCLITRNMGKVFSPAGGYAFVGDRTDPAWIFEDWLNMNVWNISVASAHEAGHMAGLNHISKIVNGVLQAQYHPSFSDWGPIMGYAYNTTRPMFAKGLTPWGSVEDQDSILTSSIHTKPDDYGNNAAHAYKLNGKKTVAGILSDTLDRDVFYTHLNKIQLSAQSLGAANVQIDVYNTAGIRIASVDNLTSLSVDPFSIKTSGGCFIEVKISPVPLTNDGYTFGLQQGKYTLTVQ